VSRRDLDPYPVDLGAPRAGGGARGAGGAGGAGGARGGGRGEGSAGGGAGDGFAGLHELYGEVILDHNRKPRNFGRLAGASHTAVGHNPLCGDRVVVDLRVAADRIEEVAFEGVGCAISTASASMMTEALRGKSLAEARRLFERFHALVTEGSAGAPAGGEGAGAEDPEMDKLAAFSGVREFPMRVKCATLAWHAVQAALSKAAPAAAAQKEMP
jgi:nitrogen fixation protein NifU and related proteins